MTANLKLSLVVAGMRSNLILVRTNLVILRITVDLVHDVEYFKIYFNYEQKYWLLSFERPSNYREYYSVTNLLSQSMKSIKIICFFDEYLNNTSLAMVFVPFQDTVNSFNKQIRIKYDTHTQMKCE